MISIKEDRLNLSYTHFQRITSSRQIITSITHQYLQTVFTFTARVTEDCATQANNAIGYVELISHLDRGKTPSFPHPARLLYKVPAVPSA